MKTLSTGTLIDLLERRSAGMPNSALQHFDSLGLPGNKTEQYRHFGIKPILARSYAMADVHDVIPEEGNYIEIVDGVVVRKPEGVMVTMETAPHDTIEHFDALYHAGHLLCDEMIVININTDSKVKIHHHITQPDTLLMYRLAVNVNENVHAQVYETFENTAEADGALVLYGYDINVDDYGTLEWIRNQNIKKESYTLIGSHHVTVADNAQMKLKTYDFGAGTALHLYQIDMESYTDFQSAHLVYATEHAKRGNVLHLRHHGKNAKSVQQAKYIINDHATGIFDGLIRVGHEAKFANVRQNSKAMLLSENGGARMSAKPQLEIYTDELEASHGSSTGQLDASQIFYLRSRGLDLNEARKMLIFAFAYELIEYVEDDTIRQEIEASFEDAHTKDKS